MLKHIILIILIIVVVMNILQIYFKNVFPFFHINSYVF